MFELRVFELGAAERGGSAVNDCRGYVCTYSIQMRRIGVWSDKNTSSSTINIPILLVFFYCIC